MVLYTKLALADEFRRQAERKPIDKITVRELVAATQMNPKTFYYHFGGIADLMKWFLERDMNALFDGKVISAGDDWYEAVLEIMDYISDNRRILKSIAESKYWPEMRFFLCSMYERYIAELLRGVIARVESEDGVPTKLSAADFELNVSFYGLLFYSAAERWFFDGMKVPKEEYLQSCIKIVGKKNMDDAIRRFR